MSNSLGKALTTVFVLGIVVSFSSLLFLVIFYNFSVLPSIPVIISVLVCAGFQLAAYLGGVVFQKRIWPAILCMLVCSVGTAWAGAVGPGALFGMPGTILANADKTFSNPLYLASMPVTIVGFGAGIAYFVLGVSSLLYDSHLTNRERENANAADAHKSPDKAAIYSHVTDMLGVTGELEAPDAAPVLVGETDEAVEEVAEETVPLDEEPAEPPVDEAEEEEPAAEESACDEADSTDETEVQKCAPDDALPEPDDGDASDAPVDEDGQPPEIEEEAPAADAGEISEETGEEPAAEAAEEEEAESAPVLDIPSTPTGSVFSRLTAKIATFFAVEQPEEVAEAEEPAAEKPLETEAEPSAEESSAEDEPKEDVPEDEPPEPEAEVDAGDAESEEAETAVDEAETREITGEDSADSVPDEGTPDCDEDEDKPAPASDDEAPNADAGVDADDTEDAEAAGEADAAPEAGEPEPGEDATHADTPADDADTVTDIEKATEVLEEKSDDTLESEEIPPFLAMRRSELLSDWAETPCVPVPLEDVAVSLETDRLRILRLDKTAFSALLQGIEEMEAATGLTPSGEQLDPHTLDTFDSLYTRALEDPQNYKWFAVWIITTKAENKLLGSAGFKGCPDGDGEVELGYGVNENHRGNNYADEAAVALCQWALLQQDVRAVTAETALANMEPENLVEKAGLKRVKETSTSCFWRLEKQEGA